MTALNQHDYQLFPHHQTEHGIAPQRADARQWSRRLLRLLVAGALLLTALLQPLQGNRAGGRFSLAGASDGLTESVGSEPVRVLGATWAKHPPPALTTTPAPTATPSPTIPAQPTARMPVMTVAPAAAGVSAGDVRVWVFLPLVELAETQRRVLPNQVPATLHTATTCEKSSEEAVQTTASSRAACLAAQPAAHALTGDAVFFSLVANAIGFNVSLALHQTSRSALAQVQQAVPAPTSNAIFLPLVTNRIDHDSALALHQTPAPTLVQVQPATHSANDAVFLPWVTKDVGDNRPLSPN